LKNSNYRDGLRPSAPAHAVTAELARKGAEQARNLFGHPVVIAREIPPEVARQAFDAPVGIGPGGLAPAPGVCDGLDGFLFPGRSAAARQLLLKIGADAVDQGRGAVDFQEIPGDAVEMVLAGMAG